MKKGRSLVTIIIKHLQLEQTFLIFGQQPSTKKSQTLVFSLRLSKILKICGCMYFFECKISASLWIVTVL